jgi:hypothetical protein
MMFSMVTKVKNKNHTRTFLFVISESSHSLASIGNRTGTDKKKWKNRRSHGPKLLVRKRAFVRFERVNKYCDVLVIA